MDKGAVGYMGIGWRVSQNGVEEQEEADPEQQVAQDFDPLGGFLRLLGLKVVGHG
jgi:hypothetical protein